MYFIYIRKILKNNVHKKYHKKSSQIVRTKLNLVTRQVRYYYIHIILYYVYYNITCDL